jgi:hypothetical protein
LRALSLHDFGLAAFLLQTLSSQHLQTDFFCHLGNEQGNVGLAATAVSPSMQLLQQQQNIQEQQQACLGHDDQVNK